MQSNLVAPALHAGQEQQEIAVLLLLRRGRTIEHGIR